MIKVLLIGAGRGGASLLQFLSRERDIEIVGVADINPEAPGLRLAKKLGLSTSQDFHDYLKPDGIDIIIDVSGRPEVESELYRQKPPHAEIMSGLSARMMWAMVDEREKRHFEQKILYDASKALATIIDISERLQKALKIVLSLFEDSIAAVYLFDENSLLNCWQVRGCEQRSCPAHEDTVAKCWSFMAEKKLKKVSDCAECIIFLSAALLPVAVSGIDVELFRRGRLNVGHFDLSKPLLEKIPVVNSRVSTKNQLLRLQDKNLQIRSQVIFPLIVSEQVNGILYLASEKERTFHEEDIGLLSTIADDIAMAVERFELRQELNERLVEQRLLCEVGIALTSEEDVPRLFSMIVHTALKLTDCPAGSLAIYRQESGEFELAASVGFSTEFSRVCRWRRRPGGLTDYILKSGKPVIISDVNLHPTFDNPILLKEGIKSLISIPLISQDRIVGVLYVDDFKPRNFSARETLALALLATQAAVAIEKAQLLKKAEELAIRDGLTGLYNYRYFHQRIEQELQRARRYKSPLSLIMADLDFFKDYNDRYGHLKGDDVLREVSKLLLDSVRKVDFVARYGGEEFAVILPETDEGKAKIVSERIRQSVEKHLFPYEKGKKNKLTISLGTVVYPHDGKTKLSLIKRADEALYYAKNTGRNHACLYSLLKKRKSS